MSTDALHAVAILTGFACFVGGAYLICGAGAALCVFGGLLMSCVIFARTRIQRGGE